MKRRFKAVGKGIGYIGLYLGVQIPVTIVCMVIYIITRILREGEAFVFEYFRSDPMEITREITSAIAYPLLIFSSILTLCLFWMLFRLRNRSVARELSLHPFRPILILPLVLLGVSMNLLVGCAMSFLPEAWLEAYNQSASMLEGAESIPLAVQFLGAALLVPLTEEATFRGLAMTRLKRAFPWWAAAGIQALLFGLCHGQWLWMVYAGLSGLLMGWVFLRVGSLWASFLVHAAFNAFSFVPIMADFTRLGDFCGVLAGLLLVILSIAALRAVDPKTRLHTPPAWVEEPETPISAPVQASVWGGSG